LFFQFQSGVTYTLFMENAMSKASSGSGAARASSAAGMAAAVLGALKMRLRRNRDARRFHALNDFMLKDMGLSRADMFHAGHGKIKRHG
jgi:uncharacterized protein YjiS (DUF1127 family)